MRTIYVNLLIGDLPVVEQIYTLGFYSTTQTSVGHVSEVEFEMNADGSQSSMSI